MVLLIEKKSNWKTEDREFANFLRSPEQFIQPAKGQNNFWDRMFFFVLVPGGFSDLIHYNNYNSNLKKWLAFRKPAGKVRN